MAFTAILTRLQLVDFDRNGTLREALGFTSMTYTLSAASTINWILNRPTMPIPSPSLVV